MQHSEVVEAAKNAGVALIRFEYCDVSGVARTKAIHVDQLAHKLIEGVSLTRAQMAIDLLEQLVDVQGMEPVGEIRLVPDPATFTVLPWAPGTASVLCDQLGHDRLDWGACPRSYLKSVLARAAGMGIEVQATFENEYYLARDVEGRFVPYDVPGHAPVYSVIGHDHAAGLMVELVHALQAQGMVSSTGFDGGFQVPLSRLLGEVVGSVLRLELDRGQEADLAVQAAEVEPVDVLGDCDLQLVDVLPGSAVADELGLEQAVERLGHGIVVAVALASDRGDGAGLGEAFGVADGEVLHPSVGVKPNSV